MRSRLAVRACTPAPPVASKPPSPKPPSPKLPSPEPVPEIDEAELEREARRRFEEDGDDEPALRDDDEAELEAPDTDADAGDEWMPGSDDAEEGDDALFDGQQQRAPTRAGGARHARTRPAARVRRSSPSSAAPTWASRRS